MHASLLKTGRPAKINYSVEDNALILAQAQQAAIANANIREYTNKVISMVRDLDFSMRLPAQL
jgi:hypothetical protein